MRQLSPHRTFSKDTLEDGLLGMMMADERDILGRIAYSIHRQHRAEWEQAVAEQFGRPPLAEEIRIFLLGEGSPRRIRAYRLMAQLRMTNEGTGGAASQSFIQRTLVRATRKADAILWWRKLRRRAMVAASFALVAAGIWSLLTLARPAQTVASQTNMAGPANNVR